MSKLFWQTDAQMARLASFFPKSHDRPRVDDCRDLSDMIFIKGLTRETATWCA